MLLLHVLLVLPAATALAMPLVTVTKISEIIKRGDAIAGPPVQPVPSQSPTYLSPAPGPPAPVTTITNEPSANCAGPCPMTESPADLILPHADLAEEIIKRGDAVAGPPILPPPSQSTAPAPMTTNTNEPAPPDTTVPLVSNPTIKTVPLVPTSPSELILPHKEIRSLNNYTHQPSLPSFIDTFTCLCGLLLSASTLPTDGELDEMWRCTASTSTPITQGTNGKWYNTTLPSTDVSGVGKPRNWGGNPPDVGMTYVLVVEGGDEVYEMLDAEDAGALVGGDWGCNGVNDTRASGVFYGEQ